MIHNATLIRLDPPGGPEGPAIAIRCALTPLTSQQQRMSDDAGWNATGVLYIALQLSPDPRPQVSGYALVHADVEQTATLYAIKHVIEQIGHTLAHIQVYLTPAE